MANRSRSNRQLVPECKQALDRMKYEVAAELGLCAAPYSPGADTEFAGELGSVNAGAGKPHIQWDQLATREAGAVGGAITRRLIEQAELVLRSH